MRVAQQQPQSQFPVIPSGQIDVPAIAVGKVGASHGIALRCQLTVKDVVGKQVVTVKWGGTAAAVGKDEGRAGADQVQRPAVLLGTLDDAHIGGYQIWSHDVVAVIEEDPFAGGLLKSLVTCCAGSVV